MTAATQVVAGTLAQPGPNGRPEPRLDGIKVYREAPRR